MSQRGSELFDDAAIARRRLRMWAAVAVGLVAVVRLGGEVVPLMRRPDLVLVDLWQSVRGTRRPSPQIAIVAVDEKSISRFGPPAWPRSEYVPLVRRLSAAGARVIGFDFTFGTLEREAANSEAFAAAMKEAGNVVFGYEFTDVGDPTPPGKPVTEILQRNALSRFESVALLPAPSLIDPEPVLAEAAAALGHVRTVSSEDGRMRELPLLIQHGDKAYPSLGLQLARLYSGIPLDTIRVKAEMVSMGDFQIPVSPSGAVLLNWPAEGERAFPQYSFLDVVRGDVPDDAFRGKVVLVAGTASGLDDRAFPFAATAPGVLIYATFLDNVFRVDFVRAPVWAWLLEWGLFLVACVLGAWLLPRLSTPQILVGVPGIALILLGGAAFLYVQKGLWLKVFYPILALLVPLALVVARRLTASEKETRDVVAENLENQKLLGLSFQEKGMLDMALATFGKLPFTDDIKLIYFNLGLDYENRGQRDKAFLVYKKVHDADPGFEDVARRMERLSQAGASLTMPPPSFSGATAAPAPTARPTPAAAARTAVPAPTAGSASASPLAHLVATPVPTGDVPTVVEGSLVSPPTGPSANVLETNIPTRAGPAPVHHPTPAGGRTGGVSPTLPGGPVGPGGRLGRYEIDRHIGRGGMGDVYLVRDTIIDRKAALKTIRPDADLSPTQAIEMRQRFYREAQTAGKLTHPNIVTVYDVGEDLGMSYIVMEFVEGDTLSRWMKRQRFTVAQIKHVIFHAGMGLDYAHEHGVFHRDVKPDNIMLSKSGLVKVMDFGIARVVESSLTKTGSVIGTPAYMSPEQVHGRKIDARSDIFSLGVILYELLTGRKPFTGETISSLMFAIIKDDPTQPSAVDAKVSAVWDEVLGKALAKEPDARYASVSDMAQAVRDAPVS